MSTLTRQCRTCDKDARPGRWQCGMCVKRAVTARKKALQASAQPVCRTCHRPPRPGKKACDVCAKRQGTYKASQRRGTTAPKPKRPAAPKPARSAVPKPERVTAEYACEEFSHLVRYGIRFSEIARRLGISKDQLRNNIAGKVPQGCCDWCGVVFSGSTVYCTSTCRHYRDA